MNSESNCAVVERFYAAMAAGDIEGILAALDPQVVVRQAEVLPWGGRFEGHDGFLEFGAALLSTIESKVEIDALFEAGDHVVQRGRTRGTVRATGAPFDIAEVHVHTVRDGRIVASEMYIDTPAMLAALGAPGPA